jgi:hypothetical protein
MLNIPPLRGRALSGGKDHDVPIEWLRKAGIPFMVSAKGVPVVALKEIDRRLIQNPKIRRIDQDGSKLWLVR